MAQEQAEELELKGEEEKKYEKVDTLPTEDDPFSFKELFRFKFDRSTRQPGLETAAAEEFDGTEGIDDSGSGGGSRKLIAIIAAVVLVVGGGGAGIGYYFMSKGKNGATPAATAGAIPAKIAAAPVIPTDTMALPPRPGPEKSSSALIQPPMTQDLSATDKSLSRRPWLSAGNQATPGAPGDALKPAPEQAGNQAAPAPLSAPGAAPPSAAAKTEPAAAPSSAGPPPQQSVAAVAPGGSGPRPAPAGSLVQLVALREPPMPPAESGGKPPRFDGLPALPKAAPLSTTPVPTLVAQTPDGLLPVASSDGNAPMKAYARPFAAPPETPRVAVIVTGLGLKKEATEAAIDRLPADVTLSFSPYGQNLKNWMERARAAGHEVMLDLPMEPDNFPVHDPGPNGLLTILAPQDNVIRLTQVLARTTNYVGLVADMGGTFLAAPTQILPVAVSLRERGLMFVDNGAAGAKGALAGEPPPGLAYALADLAVDEKGFAASIDARLNHLVTLSKARGGAIGLARARPVTYDRLAAWAGSLASQGAVLAPASAVVPPPRK